VEGGADEGEGKSAKDGGGEAALSRMVLERRGHPYTVSIKRIAPGCAFSLGLQIGCVFLRMLVALVEFIADRAFRRDAPSGTWDAGGITRNFCASAAELRARRGQAEDAHPPKDMPPSPKDAESSVASSALRQEMDIAVDTEGHIRSQDNTAAAHGDEPAHG
jgi:hypothetical protein